MSDSMRIDLVRLVHVVGGKPGSFMARFRLTGPFMDESYIEFRIDDPNETDAIRVARERLKDILQEASATAHLAWR